MKINIKEMNRQWQEKLPPDFKVIERLHYSPLHGDYLLYCSRGKEERALCYFDGIEEMPTRIEMFYVTPITNEDKLK